MNKPRISLASVLLATLGAASAVVERSASAHDLAKLERSFWLNASLASPQLGYWGTGYPMTKRPTDAEIGNAARLLTHDAAANKLYLICHHEMPLTETREVLLAWRKSCPAEVEIVPTLVLRMYDKPATPVFTVGELDELCEFFKTGLAARHVGIYDVYPKRDQAAQIAVLAKHFPSWIVRVGLQPDEKIEPPVTGAVADTWSGFCHGLTNEDWHSPGFGASTLLNWVAARNSGAVPIAWDLIVVAWDYSKTKRGEYPGYDDANKNLPLPAGRNRLAVADILSTAVPGKLAGFSSDLLILQLNSASQPHDGTSGAFYQTLKAGRTYDGFFAAPWNEISAIYRDMRNGRVGLLNGKGP